MRWILLPLLILATGTSVAYGANPSDSPAIGRYQLGGTERDGLILIDTATGMSWKYNRDVRPGADDFKCECGVFETVAACNREQSASFRFH